MHPRGPPMSQKTSPSHGWLVGLPLLLSSQVQSSVTDLSKFSKIVKLKAFQPFESAANALENANNISEGENGGGGRPPEAAADKEELTHRPSLSVCVCRHYG